PVLHLFPHWNWKAGDTVDVWAYYNNADEVELFLNGKSVGTSQKTANRLHAQWRVAFQPGTLEAVSKKNGKTVLRKTIKTAGKPAQIELLADRKKLKGANDLSFVTVRIVDAEGNLVPDAENLVRFTTEGAGSVIAVDNGSPTSAEPFKASNRKAFNGLCLAIVQSNGKKGAIRLTATAAGLPPATVQLLAD
ncbi:MAG TPA: DUF4982 domain-containing protein, partial [Flavisolibacter sp.]|nr:DUF4982 domain-containing protein [Flavisolibacter sp.]